MSGARFARAARCRFFVYVSILVLMMGMLIIFHNSQLQLDEARQQRLVCEQQQETLNDRLSSLVEKKFYLEKLREQEQAEQLELKRNLGQRIKELEESMQSEKLQSQVRYEKLEQSKQQLESKHEDWVKDCSKAKEQQLENTNTLEKQLQSLQSELHQGKSLESSELNLWKEKYNIVQQENQNLKEQLKDKNRELDDVKVTVADYREHCAYQPILSPITTNNRLTTNSSQMASQTGGGGETLPMKSFHVQETIADGIYHVNISEKMPVNASVQQQQQPSSLVMVVTPSLLGQVVNQSSSSMSSIGNIQIPKIASEKPPKPQPQPFSPRSLVTVAQHSGVEDTPQNGTGIGSSEQNSNLMRPALSAKKLPENVAPIPDNFEKLLDKSKSETPLNNNYEEGAAPTKKKKLDKSLNSAQRGGVEEHNNGEGVMMMVGERGGENGGGDRPLLDVNNNLNNEVAADQGKEFGDNLRMDEADVDDGGDDDDYSNPSARKQEDQAIRN